MIVIKSWRAKRIGEGGGRLEIVVEFGKKTKKRFGLKQNIVVVNIEGFRMVDIRLCDMNMEKCKLNLTKDEIDMINMKLYEMFF